MHRLVRWFGENFLLFVWVNSYRTFLFRIPPWTHHRYFLNFPGTFTSLNPREGAAVDSSYLPAFLGV